MARPSAEVINSCEVNDQLSIDILAAESLYAILYRSQTFSIKQKRWNSQGLSAKYIRTVFPHKSSAENLATKLNEYFNTDEFSVKKLI